MPSLTRIANTSIALGALCGVSQGASEPPNGPAEIQIAKAERSIEIRYDGQRVFEGRYSLDSHLDLLDKVDLRVTSETGARGEVTQHIALSAPSGTQVILEGVLACSTQAFPAETASPAQERFKLVRNSVGLSSNLRNNAVYDRKRDWMLEGKGETQIKPVGPGKASREFKWISKGAEVNLTFRPRYYQKHKNLPYFRPWEYDVWKGSVTGWCSWWAYMADVTEKDVEEVSQVFADKLRDFGYSYIQIDDGYQSGAGGLPKDWLHTNSHFPSGLEHLSKSIQDKGLDPALWLNVHFGDEAFTKAHKDWFIQDRNGNPHKGPWIDFGLDGSVKDAIDTVVRPTYRAIHKMGWRYIKVDALRHLLYDATYPRKEYFENKGIRGENAFRDYLTAIREEVGSGTYMLACWGVLPEVIGIANACRLGGDGFGPSTLQQYTSWNNVVWRNDPDHCDVKPVDHATGKYVDGEEKIRPVLVSMAGAQLLLSDKPDVYRDDANLEGVKRSSPILFAVPGQLYDYDSTKTDHLKEGFRNTRGGADSGPIDADQRGEVCPWWMLDINQPFESWTVLTRMNWHSTLLDRTSVKLSDIGLAPGKYSVFEFWSKKYLGDFENEFPASALAPKDVATYSIRKTLSRPQILSTSRHISQGGVDLLSVNWKGRVLSGSSNVVKHDAYSIYVRLPEGYSVKSASFAGKPAELRVEDQVAEIKLTPESTGPVRWRIEF